MNIQKTLWALPLLLTACAGTSNREMTPPTVQTATVEYYDASQILEFPGRVKATQEVNLGFKVAGRLQRFNVAEGAAIHAGQVLAELDPRDYRLQYEAVEAEYKRIKAQAERVMALYADSVATAEEYDQARYGLQQIEAKYQNCKNQLADTELRAPFDGFLHRRIHDVGTVIGAGMPVVSIVSGGAPEVEINIPGSEYIRRADFAGFEAVFDFWPDRKIPLRLLNISPKANANQLYTVHLAIVADKQPMPAPGMTTMVQVTFRRAEHDWSRVPAIALFSEGEESCLWVLGADSTVTRRVVRLESLHTDGSAVIGGGVTPGEQIVTAGVHKLHEGEKVIPMAPVSKTNVGGLL